MKRFLERMRGKSRHMKESYAFATAVSVTLLIALVWGISLPARFADTQALSGTEEGGVASPGFTDLVESAKSQLGSVAESVQELNALEDESGEVPTYASEPTYDTSLVDTFEIPTDENAMDTDTTANPPTFQTEQKPLEGSPQEPKEAVKVQTGPRTVLIATTTSEKGKNP